MKKYTSKSFFLFSLLNGRFMDIITPWYLELNLDNTYVKLSRRNWYLIGIDTNIYSFRFIRSIRIDSHLFGADLELKVTGGVAKVYSIPKKEAIEIKNLVIDYNSGNKGRHIIVH